MARRPVHTHLPGGTDHTVGAFIDSEAATIQAIGLTGLPAIVAEERDDHVHRMLLLARHQHVCHEIAGGVCWAAERGRPDGHRRYR